MSDRPLSDGVVDWADDPGHEQIRASLGAWLMNQADETERWLVEQHMTRCLECREEAKALRPVVALLSQVDLDELEAPAELPKDQRIRTVAAAAPAADEPAAVPSRPDESFAVAARADGPAAAAPRAVAPRAVEPHSPDASADELAERRGPTRPEEWSPSLRRPPRRPAAEPAAGRAAGQRRGSGSRLLVAAAAVALLALVGAVGIAAGRASVDSGPQRVATAEDLPLEVASPGVAGTGEVIAHTWGVEVKLVLTGLDQGAGYTAEVLDAAGEPVDAGGFVGTGAAETRCNLNAALRREQASGFAVRDADGGVVLQAEL